MGMFYGWIPPRSKQQPKRERKFRPLVSLPVTNQRMEEFKKQRVQCPSVGHGIGNATISNSVQYEDLLLAEREAKAREVKHTVAPICNKGGLQYISDEADLKTAGRKV